MTDQEFKNHVSQFSMAEDFEQNEYLLNDVREEERRMFVQMMQLGYSIRQVWNALPFLREIVYNTRIKVREIVEFFSFFNAVSIALNQ